MSAAPRFRRALVVGFQLVQYVGAPALAALAPLLVIPAVTSRYGAEGWASVAVALSVGLAAAVIAELGWTIVGPQLVARQIALGDTEGAARTFERALAARYVAVAIMAVPTAAVSASLATEHRAAAALLGLGVLAGAMSPSWYYTALGRPGTILVVESLPRMCLALGAAAVIAAGGPLEAYGAALCAAAAMTLVLSSRLGGTAVWPGGGAFRAAPATIRSQCVVTVGRSITTLYKALPTAVLAGVAPGAVPAYSAVDRPLRMGFQFLAVVPQRLQAWIGVPDPAVRRRRVLRAVLLNVLLGVVAGGAAVALMPPVVQVLFSGVVAVAPELVLLGGALTVVVCASRGLGLALVSEDRADATTWAAASSAVVGLPGVVVGGMAAGAAGALVALVLAELAGVVMQSIVLARAMGASPRPAAAIQGGAAS